MPATQVTSGTQGRGARAADAGKPLGKPLRNPAGDRPGTDASRTPEPPSGATGSPHSSRCGDGASLNFNQCRDTAGVGRRRSAGERGGPHTR